jgi:ATP-binding protein involved in chromosome partitioning
VSGARLAMFGEGGGQRLAEELKVPLLGQVPLDTRLREGGDGGTPVVLGAPDSPAAVALRAVARQLSQRARGLSGRSLGLTPTKR